MNRRTGTFEEFKDYTLAVARGERRVDSSEPKIWRERSIAGKRGEEPKKSAAIDSENPHYVVSTLRERIVEHLFVGEALRKLWQLKIGDVEVLRSEVDADGYDLVMSYRKIVRHIQFKTVRDDGKAANVKVSLKLMEKPSGCVVWIVVDDELNLKAYRWFGDAPGKPLPDIRDMKVAKHTKGNAQGAKLERPSYRIVPRSRFVPLATLDAVLVRLFGPLP